MIIERSREFTVNMGNYESLKLGAKVTLDSKDYVPSLDEAKEPQKVTEFLIDSAEGILQQALAADMTEAGALTHTDNSFVLTWGK